MLYTLFQVDTTVGASVFFVLFASGFRFHLIYSRSLQPRGPYGHRETDASG